MEEAFSAKDVISKFFYDFSANMMEIISANDAMTLNGLPGLILAFCCIAELIYIILDQMNGQEVMTRILKMCLYFGITMMVFGHIGYSSLGLTRDLPANIRPQGQSDLLRDSHAFLRFYFDKIAANITGEDPSDPKGKDKGITEIVKKSGLARQICDTKTGGSSEKLACAQKYLKMEYKDIEKDFLEATKCGTTASIAGMPDFFCRLPHYVTMENIFVLMVKVLYLFRFIGFLIVLFGYILTVVMTYMLLKILFPFIIFSKTRDQILQSTKFFMSTTTIVALLTFIEYVINLCLASLMVTAGKVGTESWTQFGIYFVLSGILSVIVFGVEIAMYFKVPSIASNVWDLNIKGLVTISEAAKDGLKMGMQLLGLGTGTVTAGSTLSIAKMFGLSKGIGNVVGGDNGGGDGGGESTSTGGGNGGGGGSNNSNLSNEKSGGEKDDYPGRDKSTQGRYAGSEGGGSNRQAPESQVDPSDLDGTGGESGAEAKVESGSEAKPENKTESKSEESSGSSADPATAAGATAAGAAAAGASQAASSGSSPKSEVDPNELKKDEAQAAKAAKEKANKTKAAQEKAKETKGNDYLGNAWNISKTGAGLAFQAMKFTGKAALHAAAGDFAGAFEAMAMDPMKKFSEAAGKKKEDVLQKNFEKKWGGGVDDANLERGNEGRFRAFSAEGKAEFDKIGEDISGMESEKDALSDKLSAARQKDPMGNGGAEAQAIREQMANLEKEIEVKKELQQQKQKKYHEDKAEFIEKLKDRDFTEKEKEELKDLLADPDSFTSDELKDIFQNSEVAEFVKLNELKAQTEAETARIEKLIEEDLKKSQGQLVSAKTRAELQDSWKNLDRKKREKMLQLVNSKVAKSKPKNDKNKK